MTKLPQEVHDAVSKLTSAAKEMADARRTLARLTRPGHPAYLIDRDWVWAHELMEARREKLLALPGVVGVGLGFRLRAGMPTGEPCLSVYVHRKRSPEELAAAGERRIPRTVSSGGHRLSVDVLELGAIRRQIDAGDSIGPLPISERGTVGALAHDLDAGDTVALTAMHVTGIEQFPAAGAAAPTFVSPVPGDPFGSLRQGTMSGIDAAKLALQDQQPAITVLPQIGRVRGWRPIAFPGDQGTPVRLFGATSQFQSGYIVNPIASLPTESLDAAILVNIPTQGGDSGAALVDQQGLVLGFLVGEGGTELNNLRVFTPASLVLSLLRCDIPNS